NAFSSHPVKHLRTVLQYREYPKFESPCIMLHNRTQHDLLALGPETKLNEYVVAGYTMEFRIHVLQILQMARCLLYMPNARSTRGFVVKAQPQRNSRRCACDCYDLALRITLMTM